MPLPKYGLVHKPLLVSICLWYIYQQSVKLTSSSFCLCVCVCVGAQAHACMNIECRPGNLLIYMNVFVYQINKNAGLNVRTESTTQCRKNCWLNMDML